MGLSCPPGGEIPTQGWLGAPLTRRRASGSVVPMIEISALTKRYGRTTAVSDLTFTVRPGVVTGPHRVRGLPSWRCAECVHPLRLWRGVQ
jgi:hypothetical protein